MLNTKVKKKKEKKTAIKKQKFHAGVTRGKNVYVCIKFLVTNPKIFVSIFSFR